MVILDTEEFQDQKLVMSQLNTLQNYVLGDNQIPAKIIYKIYGCPAKFETPP